MRQIRLLCCLLALGLTTSARPTAFAATIADSFDDWSFDGVQGENSWFYGYYNLTLDVDGEYATEDFEPFFNEFGAGGGPVSPEDNHWTGTAWDMTEEAMGPWSFLAQEVAHPNGTNSAPNEEHWVIRRWISTYEGEGSLISQLAAQNLSGSGTSVYLYQNGNLLDSLTTNLGTGVANTVGTTFAIGDVIDLALSPVGVDFSRNDGSDGSLFRLTVTDEPGPDPPDPPTPPFADSVMDWSATGTQGEKNWFNGYYNLTQDLDGEYQVGDFIPFFNEFGAAGGSVDPDGNHWNGAAWDLHPSAGPWTTIGVTDTHPNGTNSAPNDEHWTIRRWVADDLTTTTPLELTWTMAKTNLTNDGVTGKLFVNGAEVDNWTVAGDDGIGVTRKFYINAEPGDTIDLALTPVGLTNEGDGSDGSRNQLTIRTELPDGPLYNPVETIADSRAEFSSEQGQDNWFYGYYDQLTDVLEGDAVYQAEDFIPYLNDGTDIISQDDGFGDWKEWENHWDGGEWDVLDNGVVAHGPWTSLTLEGGHPAANAQGDEEVHWTIRRWVSDVEGDVNISGLLNNTSASGDGTVGRILLDGEEVWSEVSNGTRVDVDVNVTLTIGSVLDFAIDPDGAGNFDPEDPEGTIGLIADGSDGTDFYFRLQRMELFTPEGTQGDYNNNGSLDAGDLDMQAQAIAGGLHPKEFDLNGDDLVNFADREEWVNGLKNTWIGDADLNGEFSSGDMVQVFARGKYERAGVAAGWEDGDWNGDTVFGSSDMVAAFVAGGYEKGLKEGGPNPAVSAVPEPSALVLALVGLLSLLGRGRRED